MRDRIFGHAMLVLLALWATGCAIPTDATALRVLYGNLHAHTAASDGIGTVDEAIRYAREVARIDFLAVTDHDYLLDEEQYRQLMHLAAHESSERFLVLPGFEWSSADYGHVVVIGSDRLTTSRQVPSLRGLVAFARRADALLIVAHPSLLGRPERVLRELQGNDVIVGVEVAGAYDWPSSGYRYRRYDLDALAAFARGWTLGVGIGQDNHHGFWGGTPIDPAVGKGRTGWIGVLSPSLRRADVIKAIRLGHTFATEDRALRLIVRANGRLMGETLSTTGPLRFSIAAAHPDLARSRITLYEDNYETPIFSLVPSAAEITQSVAHMPDSRPHVYFARVELPDGRLAWSSPIRRLVSHDVRAVAVWTEPEVPVAGQDLTVRAVVLNRGTAPATAVRYRIYDVGRSLVVADGHIDVPAATAQEVSVVFKTPFGAQEVHLRLALATRPGDDAGDNAVASVAALCPSPDAVPVTVEVTRDFGAITLSSTSVSASPCAPALDALGRAASIDYAGGLVYGIDGVGSPSENTLAQRYWCFAVNGRRASEGVGTYRLRPGDTISFDLHSWVAEDPAARSCTAKAR